MNTHSRRLIAVPPTARQLLFPNTLLSETAPRNQPLAGSWTRRDWLVRNSAAVLLASHPALQSRSLEAVGNRPQPDAELTAKAARYAELSDPDRMKTLAKRAVEAAHSAGASYADARLTRVVQHRYEFVRAGHLMADVETVGLGVRALVNGYWGFAASPIWNSDEAARLAGDAVSQAQVNGKGTPRTVELGQYPVVTGTWSTPVRIDPFTVTMEEKSDYLDYWEACVRRLQCLINGLKSYIHFSRQERVTATSEGSCFSQTLYESGGVIAVWDKNYTWELLAQGIDVCAKGWELFLDTKLPEQFKAMPAAGEAKAAIPLQPVAVGRFTLVCDGATTASVVERTFGRATQLDRALGYEANAGGTSYIDDPLGMIGHFQVASPSVTVTANRSAPAQLATVKWDEEGVEPQQCTLIKKGVLTDFQTTREQAAWLGPYYAQQGRPVRSHGCAAVEDALSIPMQHMPNLALEPSASTTRVEDLVANVREGLLISGADVETDHQARNGYLTGGQMRKINNGRLGSSIVGGAVSFNTMEFWRHIEAVGGPTTQMVISRTAYNLYTSLFAKGEGDGKGQPLQLTSHSVSGVAMTIPNQPVILLSRKA